MNNLLVSKKKKTCAKLQVMWFKIIIMMMENKKQKMVGKQKTQNTNHKKNLNFKNSP
jgi:hypothetical protein